MRISSLCTLFFAALLPFQADAAMFFSSEDSLVLDSPISDDTYAGGGKITILDDIDGDLLVAGGDITIQGAVDEDIAAAGGNIRIQDSVGDDVRIAAGETRIEGNIGGDLIIFSGRVDISEVTIFGDLIVMGGDVTLAGDVRGDVFVRAGSLLSSGDISGSLNFQGAEANIRGTVRGTSKITAERIQLSDDAQFDSPVEYWVPMGDVDFSNAAKAGATLNASLGPKHTESDAMKTGIVVLLSGFIAAIATYSLLSAALFIVLALLMKKSYFADAAKSVAKEPWKNMLFGFLYFVCTPMIGLFFLFTIIGVPIGISIGVIYLMTLFYAKPLSSIVLAKCIEMRWKKKKFPLWQTSLLSVGIYIGLTITGMIPLLGWIAVMAALCTSFGAMMQTDYALLFKKR